MYHPYKNKMTTKCLIVPDPCQSPKVTVLDHRCFWGHVSLQTCLQGTSIPLAHCLLLVHSCSALGTLEVLWVPLEVRPGEAGVGRVLDTGPDPWFRETEEMERLKHWELMKRHSSSTHRKTGIQGLLGPREAYILLKLELTCIFQCGSLVFIFPGSLLKMGSILDTLDSFHHLSQVVYG